MPGGSTFFNIFLRPLIPKKLKMRELLEQTIEERLERGVGDRLDLMQAVLGENEAGKDISRGEIVATFNIFMLAGLDSIATTLFGTVFLL